MFSLFFALGWKANLLQISALLLKFVNANHYTPSNKFFKLLSILEALGSLGWFISTVLAALSFHSLLFTFITCLIFVSTGFLAYRKSQLPQETNQSGNITFSAYTIAKTSFTALLVGILLSLPYIVYLLFG